MNCEWARCSFLQKVLIKKNNKQLLLKDSTNSTQKSIDDKVFCENRCHFCWLRLLQSLQDLIEYFQKMFFSERLVTSFLMFQLLFCCICFLLFIYRWSPIFICTYISFISSLLFRRIFIWYYQNNWEKIWSKVSVWTIKYYEW